MKTKEILFEKTLALLLEKGINGVSITDIKEATGVARGLLYHYFSSKEEIVTEVINYILPLYEWEREKLKEGDILDIIFYNTEKYQHLANELFSAQPAITFNNLEVLLYQASILDSSSQEKINKMREERYFIWKTAVLKSFSKGELKSGLNLESVARIFHYISYASSLYAHDAIQTTEIISRIEKGLKDFYEIVKR